MKKILTFITFTTLIASSYSQQIEIDSIAYYQRQLSELKQQLAKVNLNSKKDHYWLKQAIVLTTSMYAGWCEGENEILIHDYWNYLKKWPNTNKQYTNPKLSAKNKYKDRDPNKGPAFFLSTTLLVGATDLYHRNKTARNLGITTAITFSLTLRKNMKFKHALLQSAIISGGFILGKGIAHQFYIR